MAYHQKKGVINYVFMYLNDVMLCYSISPEELKEVYFQKHSKNLERW